MTSRVVLRKVAYMVKPQWDRGQGAVAWVDGKRHHLPPPGDRGTYPRALYVARVEVQR